MAKRSQDGLVFEASLSTSGQCLTFAHDGEATLKLALSNADATAVSAHLQDLSGCTFFVSILKRAPGRDDSA